PFQADFRRSALINTSWLGQAGKPDLQLRCKPRTKEQPIAMDAIILAAGLGTRLRPHTLYTPKPLLPIRGRPILDWTLGALPPSVDRVLVVVHYLAEQIKDYLRTQLHFREHVAVEQAQPRGTGDA